MENQINDLIKIGPDKLHKFKAEFKSESQTKQKIEGRNQEKKQYRENYLRD